MKISIACWDREWLSFSCDVAKPKQIGTSEHVIDRTDSAVVKSQLLESVKIDLSAHQLRAKMKDGKYLVIQLKTPQLDNLMNAKTVPEMRSRSIDLISQHIYPRLSTAIVGEPLSDLTNQPLRLAAPVVNGHEKPLLAKEDLEQKMIALVRNRKQYEKDPSSAQILEVYDQLRKSVDDCNRIQKKHGRLRTEMQNAVQNPDLWASVASVKKKLISCHLDLKRKLADQQQLDQKLAKLLSELVLPQRNSELRE